MSAETLVGLDVGTSALKALAVSPGGDVVSRVEVPYAPSMPRPGWSEQDPEEWWSAAGEALGRLGDVRPIAVGVSGQMHGLVALDAGGAVIRPAILWNDQRTAAQCAEIEDAIGLERLVTLTGNRALTGFTAPKLLWLREHERSSFDAIDAVMLPKDLVRWRLTGEPGTDASDASGTLLLDVAGRSWSEDVVAALGLDPRWLPAVRESAAPAGATAGGVVVAAGAGDQAASAVGVGAVRPGEISISLGTSGVVFAVQPAYRPDPAARVHTFCHAVPDRWHTMGVMLSAAGSLRWARDVLAPDAAYDDLVGEAASAPAGGGGVTFLPYLMGERTPHADPDARAAFVGLRVEHDRAALIRSVLEGVAYGLRDCFELLQESGLEPRVARVSGGGARSEPWLRIVASVLGIPLERTEVDEGAAFGAALLAGVASGTFASVEEAAEACVRPRGIVEPDADWRSVYDDGYVRFRELYPALRRT